MGRHSVSRVLFGSSFTRRLTLTGVKTCYPVYRQGEKIGLLRTSDTTLSTATIHAETISSSSVYYKLYTNLSRDQHTFCHFSWSSQTTGPSPAISEFSLLSPSWLAFLPNLQPPQHGFYPAPPLHFILSDFGILVLLLLYDLDPSKKRQRGQQLWSPG